MTSAAGVTRTGTELDAAAAQLAQWAAGPAAADLEAGVRTGHSAWLCQDAHEDRNLLLAAELLVAAARQRTQSVGAHYRADTAGHADSARHAGTAHQDRTAQPAGTAGQSGPASLTSGRRRPAAARSMQRI